MVEDVINILIADVTVQTLVGLNKTGQKYKIYPVIAPQKESYPYIVIRQTGKVKAGKSCGYIGSYAIYSYHKSFDECNSLDLAAVSALDGVASANISFSNLTSTSDEYIPGADGDGLYCKISTFECQYEVSVTT